MLAHVMHMIECVFERRIIELAQLIYSLDKKAKMSVIFLRLHTLEKAVEQNSTRSVESGCVQGDEWLVSAVVSMYVSKRTVV